MNIKIIIINLIIKFMYPTLKKKDLKQYCYILLKLSTTYLVLNMNMNVNIYTANTYEETKRIM